MRTSIKIDEDPLTINSSTPLENMAGVDNTATGRPSRGKSKFINICVFVLTIVLILAAAVGGVYLYTHIKVQPSVRITSMSVSHIYLAPDGSRITANWTIGFEVTNPNRRYSINYTDSQVSVSYFGYNTLCATSIAPFFQKPKNQTALIAEPEADFQNIEPHLGNAIREDLFSDGTISFDVNIRLQYEYGKNVGSSSGHKGGNHKVKHDNFLCEDVEVFYDPNDPLGFGRMRDKSKSCHHYTNN